MKPSNLQPSPAYKPSGVEWLGDVPGHWDLVQLGRIGTFSKGTGGTKEDEVPEGIPCIRYGDLYTSHKYHIQATRSSVTETKAAEYTPIQYGDVLFASSGETIEEIGKSAVNLIKSSVRCGGDVILFRPDIEIDARFSGYAVDCPQSQYQKSCMGRGITIMHIYGDELKRLWLILPPLPEQAAIVRYLDYVDRRIRRYVAAKVRLVGLLEEEKQAVITRAVTRGLDPNAPLKPSGVDWLGDVPAHWEVRRTKSFFRLRTEKSGVAHGRELLSIYTHIGVRPRKDLEEKGNKASSTDDYWIVKRGDLIANKLLAWMGAIGVSHYDGVTSPAYDILMPIGDLVSDYYHHLFRTRLYLQQFKQRSRGIMDMRLRLYFDQLGLIPIPVPPVDEQQAIVECLDKATADIDAAIGRTKRQIDLIQEYRTRLIADVVTGKLDVREAAARLPNETDDRDPIDERGRLAKNIDGSVRVTNEAVGDLATAGEVTV